MLFFYVMKAPLQLYRKPLSSSTGKPLSSSPHRGEGWLACGKEAGGSPQKVFFTFLPFYLFTFKSLSPNSFDT